MADRVKQLKVSAAAKRGAADGAHIAERAATIMLQEYYDLPQAPDAPAPFGDAYEALVSALGPMAGSEAVAQALHVLEDAHGRELVDSGDRAWHAACHEVMGLLAGHRRGYAPAAESATLQRSAGSWGSAGSAPHRHGP